MKTPTEKRLKGIGDNISPGAKSKKNIYSHISAGVFPISFDCAIYCTIVPVKGTLINVELIKERVICSDTVEIRSWYHFDSIEMNSE